MTKELSRRVSSVLDDEEATHCYRPSSLVPISTKSSLRAKHQNVDYIPHGTGYKLLDPDGIYDLCNWHESERKRLKAELEGYRKLTYKDDRWGIPIAMCALTGTWQRSGSA